MYIYKTEKKQIFTEDGQRDFLKIRDRVNNLLLKSGAVTMGRAISGRSGNSWFLMACVDRLVEIGEIKEIPYTCRGQDRVFIKVEH